MRWDGTYTRFREILMEIGRVAESNRKLLVDMAALSHSVSPISSSVQSAIDNAAAAMQKATANASALAVTNLNVAALVKALNDASAATKAVTDGQAVSIKNQSDALAVTNLNVATLVKVLNDTTAATKQVMDGLAVSIKTQGDSLTAAQASIAGLSQNVADILAQLKTRKDVVPLDDAVIPAAALVTLLATEKTITMSAPGVKSTDTLLIVPKSLPVNYGLRGWSVGAANTVTMKVQCPILTLAGSGTPLTFSVTALR